MVDPVPIKSDEVWRRVDRAQAENTPIKLTPGEYAWVEAEVQKSMPAEAIAEALIGPRPWSITIGGQPIEVDAG